MILFKIIGVFWLSICSMFSNGSNESSYCDVYKELDVQESTLASKGAYTKTIDNRPSFYLMPYSELFTSAEKIQKFSQFLTQRYTTYDSNGDVIQTSGFNTPVMAYDYIGGDIYYDWYPSAGVSSSLFFFSQYSDCITNSNFGFSNMYQVEHIRIRWQNSTTIPNYYNQYTIYLYDHNDINNLTMIFRQYFNGSTNNGYYNPNISNVQLNEDQPICYFNGSVAFPGLCFRDYDRDTNPFIRTYLYEETADLEIYNNGYESGYADANTNYYESGYQDGFASGQSTINQSSYDAGYSAGMMDANGTNPYMNSIFSGIFQVGLLPVNVFLTMFNYEIFGINVSGLVSGLLTMSIIVIIFRFLFGGKSND